MGKSAAGMAACMTNTFFMLSSIGSINAMVSISSGRISRRMAIAERLIFSVNLVSGNTSPMHMPMAINASGMALAPRVFTAVSIKDGMAESREQTLIETPVRTAITGPLSRILGLSDSLPEKIMMATVNMANSTPRLCRKSVASSSLSG